MKLFEGPGMWNERKTVKDSLSPVPSCSDLAEPRSGQIRSGRQE